MQLSVAVGTAKLTLVAEATHTPGSVPIVTGAGQAMTGNSVSFTVTVTEQVTTLLPQSSMVYITVVSPFGYGSVSASISLLSIEFIVVVQLSVIVGSGIVTNALQVPISLPTTMSGAQVTIGGVLSSTVTVVIQVAVFPPIPIAI